MNISEISVGQGNIDVKGTIKEIAEPRVFDKFGRELKVADTILEDDSGSIKLNLWNDEIEKFKVGDKIKVTNGYAKEFQGEKQLTAGKFGQIEKIDEDEVSDSAELGSDEQSESSIAEESNEETSEEAPFEGSKGAESSEEDAEDF